MEMLGKRLVEQPSKWRWVETIGTFKCMGKALLPAALLLVLPAKASAETWRVSITMITPLNPINNRQNHNNYIIQQIHYPLMKLLTNGEYESEFLDMKRTRAVNRSFKQYDLCLKPNLTFSDAEPITSTDLHASLSYFTSLFASLIDVKSISIKDSQCVRLEMNRPTPYLFSKFTGTASTVLKASEVKSDNPTGLGAYVVESRSDKGVVLKSRLAKKPRFDRIEFEFRQTVPTEEVHRFSDFGQMIFSKVGAFDRSKYQIFDVPSLKIYTFGINVPDRNLRGCIAKKLKRGNWGKVYELNISEQTSFLPWRPAKPTEVGYPENCEPPKKKVLFMIAEHYKPEPVKAEILRLGLESYFDVQFVTGPEFVKVAFGSKDYVGLLAFDSSGPTAAMDGDFSLYFDSYYTEDMRIITPKLKDIEAKIHQANEFGVSAIKREELTREAEMILMQDYWVMPFGRLEKKYFLAKDLRIREWTDQINGIPAVWTIE